MPLGVDHSEQVLGPPEELAHGDFEMVVRRLADDLADLLHRGGLHPALDAVDIDQFLVSGFFFRRG